MTCGMLVVRREKGVEELVVVPGPWKQGVYEVPSELLTGMKSME